MFNDPRLAASHAREWGARLNAIATEAGIPYWRFLKWLNDCRDCLTVNEEVVVKAIAERWVEDQKIAVEIVRNNSRGISEATGISMTKIRGWRASHRVPSPYVDIVLRHKDVEVVKGMPREERARLANLRRKSTLGPWSTRLLDRIVNTPGRAYLYALATDLTVRKALVSQTISRLEAKGYIEVDRWEAGDVRRSPRKIYRLTDRGLAALGQTKAPAEAGAKAVP